MPDSLTAGTLIAGRYRLEELLGSGGMGVVWAATHTVTERAVALKFLHHGPAHLQDQLRQRFAREARAASAVRHPNVVEVLDIFELEDRTPVMVMERLFGETLGQRLARLNALAREAAAASLETTVPEGSPASELSGRAPPCVGALSLAATAALLVPAVSAIGAAHARGTFTAI